MGCVDKQGDFWRAGNSLWHVFHKNARFEAHFCLDNLCPNPTCQRPAGGSLPTVMFLFQSSHVAIFLWSFPIISHSTTRQKINLTISNCKTHSINPWFIKAFKLLWHLNSAQTYQKRVPVFLFLQRIHAAMGGSCYCSWQPVVCFKRWSTQKSMGIRVFHLKMDGENSGKSY